jgi:hypothetical protein
MAAVEPEFEVTDDPAATAKPVPAQFVESLSLVLDHLCKVEPPAKPHRFDAVKAPPLSVRDYLRRLQTYFICSPEAFAISLVYLDRVVKFQPDFCISKRSIHRLILTSLMLAVKFFDDVWYSNAYYAKVGGVSLRELNQLEAEMVRLLQWSLYVAPEEYEEYMDSVLKATADQGDSKTKKTDQAEDETAVPGSDPSDTLSETSEAASDGLETD